MYSDLHLDCVSRNRFYLCSLTIRLIPYILSIDKVPGDIDMSFTSDVETSASSASYDALVGLTPLVYCNTKLCVSGEQLSNFSDRLRGLLIGS